MGLLGLVKVAKGLVPSFLHVGAILTVIGGLFACCYNCRWYNAIGDARRGYKTVVNSAASSAMASGIFGVFAAIAAIAAVALSFTGLSNTIVTIVYAVTLVLYLGEMIPEAVLIGKTLGMAVDVRLARDRNWIYTDEDFWYFSELGDASADQNKLMPVDPTSPEYWEQEHANPERDLELWNMANNIRSGKINGLEGFSSAVSYGFLDGWGEFSFDSPCVFNFKKSSYDYKDTENCDEIDIKVERCVSTWSAGAVTRALKRICNDQKEQDEKSEEDNKWTTEWEHRGEGLQNAVMEELEKNYDDIQKTLHDGEPTMESFEFVSGWDSVEAYMDWYEEYEKRKVEDSKKYMQEYVKQGGIATEEVKLYIGMHTANQAIIAIQTVGFFFTLVGVVLSFVLSMLPVGDDDAAKPEA